MIERLIKKPAPSFVFSCLIFLLPALALTMSSGVGLIEVAVLAGLLFYAKPLFLERHELFWPARHIIAAFVISFLLAVASSLSTDFKIAMLENPFKQVLGVLVIGLIVRAKPKADWFWFGLFVGAICTGGIAIVQRFILHMDRAEGFHMPIMFGDIAMAMALMSLASIQRFHKTRWTVLPYIAFLGGLTGSLLSGSRGGWIALVLCFIPLYSYGKRSLGRKAWLIAVVGIALLVGASMIPQLGVQQRFSQAAKDIQIYQSGQHSELVTSVGARIEMWKGALKLFAGSPVLGIGRANFHNGLVDLIATKRLSPAVNEFHHAHNELLHALATQGILGGIALLMLYATPLIFFSQQLRVEGEHQPFALAGVLLVLSFVDFGLTQVMFAHHVGSAFYALTVGTLTGLCMMIRRRDHDIECEEAGTGKSVPPPYLVTQGKSVC